MPITRTQPHAQLPASRQEGTIEDMLPGDTGFTVPWAMYADKQKNLWLNGSYNTYAEPFGTANMRVERSETDGYWRVNATRCSNYRWSRGGGDFQGDFKPILVADGTF